MRKFKITNLVAAIMLAVLGVFGVGNLAVGDSAYADSQMSEVTVTPMNQRALLVPGEEWSGSIKVSNPATADGNLKYSVEVGSYNKLPSEDGKDDYGATDVTTVTDSNEIMKWITLGRTGGEIAPNSTEVVPFTINVPLDAPAGGQYATIIVKNDSASEGNSNGDLSIKSEVQIASIIYAEVTGDTRNEGQVTENSIPTFSFSSPITATSMVENNGNVHGDAEYTLIVQPLFGGDDICNNEEDPSEVIVLPNTKRYHAENCEVGPIGLYKATQTVKIFGETSTIERTVVICPIWLLFIIILVIALIIFWIVKRVRDRK